MSERGLYPFGAPLTARSSSAGGPRSVFVLGAYPSALHVRWTPPSGSGVRPVAAIPVADEPEPFWDGTDAADRIEAWKEQQQVSPDTHGTFTAPPRLNGPSGQWVVTQVLAPFGLDRSDVWITDCLDTYRASTGVAAALAEKYDDLRDRYGWPEWRIAGHPTESQIVAEAARDHRDRLLAELSTCEPELVITLGSAALRTLAGLAGTRRSPLRVDGYGERVGVELDGRNLTWLPLAHPAAPKPYQEAHAVWVSRQRPL